MRIINRGEIYYTNLDLVTGSEQGGYRPIVVLQNNIGNFYSPTTIAAAITSRLKTNMPTHVHIENKCLPFNSVILLEHIRTIDKSRLEEYKGKLTQEEISELDKALAISLGLRIREEKKNGEDKSSK